MTHFFISISNTFIYTFIFPDGLVLCVCVSSQLQIKLKNVWKIFQNGWFHAWHMVSQSPAKKKAWHKNCELLRWRKYFFFYDNNNNSKKSCLYILAWNKTRSEPTLASADCATGGDSLRPARLRNVLLTASCLSDDVFSVWDGRRREAGHYHTWSVKPSDPAAPV